MLTQVQNNNLIANKQTSTMDKNTFLNMLTMMMTDNNLAQTPIVTGNTDISNSIMELLAGSNGMTNYLDLLNTNNINTDLDNLTDNSKIGKSETDKILESSYMMQAYLSSIAPEITGLQTDQNNITESVNANFEAYMPLSNYNNLQNLKHYAPENELNAYNDETKIAKPTLSPQAEKLIANIEGKREKLIYDISSNAEMLMGNKVLSSEQTNIIQLSDESTQIKSQVLHQVRDKIVVMAEQNAEDGNTVKQVTMELNPKELGKVDIKMTIVNNKITVEVKALNEETQKIIASNADELLNILNKSSEKVSIVVKSNDSSYEHQLINNYDKEIHSNSQNYQDDQNLHQDNKKRNYYYYDKDNKSSDDDGKFSELINLRSIKLNL